MPAVLDIRTLVLIYVGINIGQAAVLVYLWSVQRNYPPAKDWAIGSLMFAIGLFLFALRNQASVVLTEIVSNLFLLPGLLLFNFGIVKAADRKPPFNFGLALCAVANGFLAWFTLVSPNYPASVLTQNLVFLTLDLYTAYACLRARTTKGNYTFRIIGILFIVLVIANVWRVAGGVFDLTFSLSPTLPRLLWIATSLISFPMITVLLTLHTSQRLQEEIHAQARHDILTQAYNRRAFIEFSDMEWARSVRHGYPLSILTVDIDHFKHFNDQHGHQTGDVALVQVSKSAQAALRTNDIWCRYGGEEFIALLPNTTMDKAMAVAERLRRSVENTTILSPRGSLSVSVSIGVAERSSKHSSLSEVLAISDAALYKAKATGRNRVIANYCEE
ncbi:diguanylate cyclase (GGDEF) domain-containing protein [Formivibrio citricus]|uniref:diguanylate cyclase n=1 Tax=Formivibrio citricus TaxID=83765 RepID=A0A1I5A5M3_9NEIS|nr:GGDEF domain-containing protein [Formivibrio citricus]SFN57732.1 diguanylate cyclase (GGDEF) domain-containing protein [Formivibrio citricus]